MIKYSVDGTKVTAEINDMRNDLTNKLMKRMGIGYVPTKVLEAATMPKRVVGVAYCHPQDVFDYEVGQELARHRAISKYNNELRKAENRVMKCLEHMLDSCGYFERVEDDEEDMLEDEFSMDFSDLDLEDDLMDEDFIDEDLMEEDLIDEDDIDEDDKYMGDLEEDEE